MKPDCPASRARAGGALPRRAARRRAIVERLNSEFAKLFSEPKFKAFLDKQAVASAPTTPAGFAAFLKAGPQGGGNADPDRQHQA